jgi:PAS domain S-box-containing protein
MGLSPHQRLIYLEALVAAVPEGLYLAAPDDRILVANTALEHLTGYAERELFGRPTLSLYVSEAGPAHQVWQRRIRSGSESRPALETELIRKDGTQVPVELVGTNFLLYGRLVGRITLVRDLRPRRQTEQTSHHTTSLAKLGRLMAGLSHELRNSLHTMELDVELLEQDLHRLLPNTPEQLRETMTDFKANLSRLHDLVQDPLSLVRLASLQREPADMGTLVQTWLRDLADQLQSRQVSLHLEGLRHLGEAVIHANTLRRAVINLVRNALEAMPEGGILRLRGRRTATQVELTVQDTGPGIPADQLSQIFEPLYTTKPDGTGLGLYLVQEIVAAHGGQVTVRSAVGRGAAFTLTIPHGG